MDEGEEIVASISPYKGPRLFYPDEEDDEYKRVLHYDENILMPGWLSNDV